MNIVSFPLKGFESLDFGKLQSLPHVECVFDITPRYVDLPGFYSGLLPRQTAPRINVKLLQEGTIHISRPTLSRNVYTLEKVSGSHEQRLTHNLSAQDVINIVADFSAHNSCSS